MQKCSRWSARAKLIAAFGSNYVKNLEDTIKRMKSGQNRSQTNSRTVNAGLDFINGLNELNVFYKVIYPYKSPL